MHDGKRRARATGLLHTPITNGANTLVVDEAGVGGGASDDELWSVKQGCATGHGTLTRSGEKSARARNPELLTHPIPPSSHNLYNQL